MYVLLESGSVSAISVHCLFLLGLGLGLCLIHLRWKHTTLVGLYWSLLREVMLVYGY